MLKTRARIQWARTWPMLCLCFVAASRWLLESAHPEMQTTALTQAVGCVSAAAILGLCSVFGRRPQHSRLIPTHRPAWIGCGWTCFGGAIVLAGPALASALSSRSLNANDATLTLALTPCVIAVGTRALGNGATDELATELTALLWPGLAGVAGLLLLLPQPVIGTWRLGLALALMPIATGWGAVLFARSRVSNIDAEPAVNASSRLVTALGFAGLLYVGLAVAQNYRLAATTFSANAASLDGLLAWLTLLALQRLRSIRWAAQFLLIPWLTLVEGAVLLRPVLDVRSWLAFALLASSGVYQLWLR